MDPFSALAIAAAVVQFIDIGAKVLSTVWSSHKQRSPNCSKEQPPEGPVDLLYYTNRMRTALSAVPATGVINPAQSLLTELCKDCEKAATDLV